MSSHSNFEQSAFYYWTAFPPAGKAQEDAYHFDHESFLAKVRYQVPRTQSNSLIFRNFNDELPENTVTSPSTSVSL